MLAMSLDGSLHRLQPDQTSTLAGHQSPVTHLCSHGETLFSAEQHGNIIVHNHSLYPHQSVKVPQLQQLGLTRGLSCNGKHLLFANISGDILKIDVGTLEVARYKIEEKEVVQSVLVGEELYVLCLDNTIQWYLPGETLVLLGEMKCDYKATCLDVCRIGDTVTLAVGSDKEVFYVYRDGVMPEKGEKVLHYEHTKIVSIKLSRDGKYLASADNKHAIRLYDLGTLQCLSSQFTFHNASITCLAFHEKHLLSCS